MGEAVITYETLFELLRLERDRTELQKLSESFFSEVVEYLEDKQKALSEKEMQKELFSYEDKRKSEKELENIKRILKELYERREKKIVGLALDKSRRKEMTVDLSLMLPKEKEIFESVRKLLDNYRSEILENMLSLKVPPEEKKAVEEKDSKLIRILQPVPRFVGSDLEIYGPFEEEDIARLPSEVADVLIGKERAEEINEG